MSANKPKPQEINQKPGRDEEEKGFQKGGQNPTQRSEQRSGGGKQETPKSGDQSRERKNR
jgi:hypothetical protein